MQKDRPPPLGSDGGRGVGEPHFLTEDRSDMGSIRDERVGCRHREAAVEAIRDTKETIKCSMIKSEAATKRVGGHTESLLQETRGFRRESGVVRGMVHGGQRAKPHESRRPNI